MKKILCLVLALLMLLSGTILSVAAETKETGFVEYETDVSINFHEIIEVTLTDNNTGYYYTHELYRINDYAGNFSVPFGTYSVSAKIISETGSPLSQYSVLCPGDEVVVKSDRIAVPISLTVNIFTLTETPSEDYDEVVSDTVVSEEDSEPPTVSKEDELINEETSSEVSGQTNENEDNSLFWSTMFFLALLVALTVGYWFFFRRRV